MTEKRKHKITQLWIEFLNENEEAFSKLYCLFYDELLGYGKSIGGNNEMVEDIIQDLFLKIYKKKINLKDRTKLQPFLYRSLRNAILNRLDRNKKMSLVNDEKIFNLKYSIDTHKLKTENHTYPVQIKELLDELTERQKEIIYLRFTKEMSYERIADIMQIKIQSARNLLSRSISNIREQFKKDNK